MKRGDVKMGAYDSSISLMKRAMDAAQNKYGEDNADNYILRCKNAVVIWYQPNTLIACVRFCEDKNNNEYHLYNRCCAYLSPGDQVKVYYTTNAAKGWIAIRCGKPNFLNEYGQNIFDISACCDNDEGNGETCCKTDCCAEAATQHKDKETVTVEEWTERIEGSKDEVREYESGLPDNPPFDVPVDNPGTSVDPSVDLSGKADKLATPVLDQILVDNGSGNIKGSGVTLAQVSDDIDTAIGTRIDALETFIGEFSFATDADIEMLFDNQSSG